MRAVFLIAPGDRYGRGVVTEQTRMGGGKSLEREIGAKPDPGLVLGRLAPAGDFAPGNVYWATRAGQARSWREDSGAQAAASHGHALPPSDATRKRAPGAWLPASQLTGTW